MQFYCFQKLGSVRFEAECGYDSTPQEFPHNFHFLPLDKATGRRLVFPRHQFGNSQVKSTLISIGNGQLIVTSSSTGGNGRQTPNFSSLAGTCQKTLEVNISMREANFHRPRR